MPDECFRILCSRCIGPSTRCQKKGQTKLNPWSNCGWPQAMLDPVFWPWFDLVLTLFRVQPIPHQFSGIFLIGESAEGTLFEQLRRLLRVTAVAVCVKDNALRSPCVHRRGYSKLKEC